MSRVDRTLDATLEQIIKAAKLIPPLDAVTRARVLSRAYATIIAAPSPGTAIRRRRRPPRFWRTIVVGAALILGATGAVAALSHGHLP